MSIRTAGLIIVGNEILSGSVKDENIHFLCQRFHDLGVRVNKVVTVGDNLKDIAEEVSEFSKTFDIVVTSGGVGPTHDDATYEAIALAFDVDLELCQELLLFWKGDPVENDESIKKMSTIPKSSKVVYTETSECERIPVVCISNVYMFPGSPDLLRSRFIGLEGSHLSGNGTTFYKREIFLSVDEFEAVPALNATVNAFRDVDIGSYPEINSLNYTARLTLHCHELDRLIKAYDMLISLLHPSWIRDLNDFSTKNKL